LRQDLVDEVEILAPAGRLLLQVHEIRRGVVEPAREERRELERDLGLAAEELDGVVDHIGLDRRQRLDRGRIRHVEQNAHFTEQRAGLFDVADLRVLAQHLDLALDQNEELALVAALGDQDGARLERLGLAALAVV